MENSLKEFVRWRIHSRATKIGQRMWNRNELCSNGEPCRSRIRNRIRPSSESSISSFRRANETRAPLTTERSSAIAPSSRTKPWSRTWMVLSETTSVTRLHRLTTFLERVLALGDRLGPVRVVYQGPRDDGTLSFVLGSIPEDVRLAFDFRHETWGAVDGVVQVNDPLAEPFRYLRLR